ncbi:MAG: ABC transporter permease [Gaiellaceae bacterium]
MRGTLALAEREVRRVGSLWTQTLLPAAVTSVLYLAIFGGALGGRLRGTGDADPLEFVLPGLLVLTVTGQAFANCSTSLFQAKNEGYVEDVLTSPLRGVSIALGYAAGGVARGLAAALLVLAATAPVVGLPNRPALTAAVLLLTSFVFAGFGVITGLWAESFDQHSFVANIVVTPLALVAGVFYEPRALGEPWQTLTLLDPLTHLVGAARAGFLGSSDASVALSLGLAAVAASGIFAAAAALIGRGWRLKP